MKQEANIFFPISAERQAWEFAGDMSYAFQRYNATGYRTRDLPRSGRTLYHQNIEPRDENNKRDNFNRKENSALT